MGIGAQRRAHHPSPSTLGWWARFALPTLQSEFEAQLSAVIASAAKQSIFRLLRHGLLRRCAPRNDDERAAPSKHLEIFAVLPVRHLGLKPLDLRVLDVDVIIHELRAQRLPEERIVAAARTPPRAGSSATAPPWSRTAYPPTAPDRACGRRHRALREFARPCRDRDWPPARRSGFPAALRCRPAPPSTRIMTPRLSRPQIARSGASE